MSTEYLAFTRINDETIELYEHSSKVDLTLNSEPLIRDMTGEEMMQLAAKLIRVCEYVHGKEFIDEQLKKLVS
jgi:hypothetical protein